jgi:NitT/TauT family transport system permease protein
MPGTPRLAFRNVTKRFANPRQGGVIVAVEGVSLSVDDGGLGYLLTFGEGAGNTAMVFVVIILLTLIGIVLYGLVVLAEDRVLHYLPARARMAA